MEDTLRIILVILSLLAGAIAIFFAFQLMKRYALGFVTSYFYYLVFLYIFGAYSLAGSALLEHLFIRLEAGEATIHSARLFTILLGIPLLILSKYMLLRSVAELLSKSLWIPAMVVYFLIALAAFILYGFFAIRMNRFDLGDYQVLVNTQRWVFAGWMAGVYSAVFLAAFLGSGKLAKQERSFARMLGTWYFLYMFLATTSFLMSRLHEIIPYIFFFIFLSWHLIPILFMNLHLERFHGERTTVEVDFGELFSVFSGKYEISKRESEVIHLICKGLSNQQISDTLFISLQTVKDHVHRIFIKTGVRNRVQLTNLIRSG
jgi:DNA-binding CsgD family transcriptional regulator